MSISPAQSIRKRTTKICEILDSSEETLQVFCSKLFEIGTIDRTVKNSVLRKRGYDGASNLITHIEMMITQQPSHFDAVLEAMENQHLLTAVAGELRELTGRHKNSGPEQLVATCEVKSHCSKSQVISTTAILSGTTTLIAVVIFYLVRDNPTTVYDKTPSAVRQTTSSNAVTPDIEKRIWIAGETGSDVVRKCVEKLQCTGIFPDDKGLMERIAYIMSRNGDASFQLHTDGGIWQVSQFAFQDSKDETAHVRLPGKYQRLQDTLGIDWRAVRRRDLEVPLYSAIAARLYLSNFAESIPPSFQIDKQQDYWWRFYMRNHESRKFMDEDDFKRDVQSMGQAS